jgi:hypothetical protein
MNAQLGRLDIDATDMCGGGPQGSCPEMGDYDPSNDDAFWNALHSKDLREAKAALAQLNALDAPSLENFERAMYLAKLIKDLNQHFEVMGVKP